MSSTRGRPSNRDREKLARETSTKELNNSNATSNAFLGAKQKEWMPFNSNASLPPSLIPPTTSATGFQSTVRRDKVTKNKYLPGTPGRSKRSGMTHDSRRRTSSGAMRLTPPVPGLSGTTKTTPDATSKGFGNDGDKSLPSPSPSIGTHRPRAEVISLDNSEDETAHTQTVGNTATPPKNLDELISKLGYDELKKTIAEMERASVATPQHEVNATVNESIRPTTDFTGPEPQAETATSVIHNASTNVQSSASSPQPSKPVQNPPETISMAPEQLPSATQQHVSSPIEPEMHSFYRKTLDRMRLTSVPNRPGAAYERPRLNMLRVACGNSDLFYLRLHQVFCVHHMYQSHGRATPSITDAHRDGLAVVSYLLVPNERLSADAIEWFSSFPLPWELLHPSRPEFQLANSKVLNCLAELPNTWKTIRQLCLYRGYPPLVEEMIVLFEVDSFTFLQVIFLALLREIWKGQQDQCYGLIEGIFSNNYKETMLRRLRNDPSNEYKAYSGYIVREFQRVFLCHGNHMQREIHQQNAMPSQHGQATSVNRSHQDRSSTDQTQRVGQSFQTESCQTNSSVTAPSPSSTHPQSRPSLTSDRPLRQHSSPQNAGFNTHTNTRLTQNQPIRSPSNGSHPSFQAQEQQPGSSHPRMPSSLPSEIVGSLAQSVSELQPARRLSHQNFPSYPILPSNVTQQGVIYPPPPPPQYYIGSQQRQQGDQPHSSNIGPYPPSQPGLEYEAHQQGLERSQQHFMSQTSQLRGTPFIHADPNLNQSQPYPARNALHQAHVRSPILSPLDSEGKPINMKKTFRFIKHVIMPPGELSSKKQFLSWDFNIEKAVADTLIKDTPGFYGSPPTRTLLPGSQCCRIRCIRLGNACAMPSQQEWAVSDNVWHSSTALVLNDNALEIRRKSHHGKDLPIDVTPYVREGLNSVSAAVMGFSEGSTARYAIGVEIIEVIEEQLIKSRIPVLPWQEACKKMMEPTQHLDSEVQVMNSQIIINLKDPFTAQLFVVPVRGVHCRHNQCFDRDTFLETRNSKDVTKPCEPDKFRCPICGSDARPPSLVTDGFLMQVREEMEKKGRLDANAIILHSLGDWEIKEEENVTGEQGDGSGRRNKRQPAQLVGASGASPEVIVIDDL